MVTKKGIALTAAIIGGFTVASFLVYLIPSQPENRVVLQADPRDEIVSVMERSDAVVNEFRSAFQLWESEQMSGDAFGNIASLALAQMNDLMLELRQSDPPQEWMASYTLYMQVLKSYAEYFEKSREYVNYASGGNVDREKADAMLASISEALARASDLAEQARDAMP